jgi:hypothetical protein
VYTPPKNGRHLYDGVQLGSTALRHVGHVAKNGLELSRIDQPLPRDPGLHGLRRISDRHQGLDGIREFFDENVGPMPSSLAAFMIMSRMLLSLLPGSSSRRSGESAGINPVGLFYYKAGTG